MYNSMTKSTSAMASFTLEAAKKGAEEAKQAKAKADTAENRAAAKAAMVEGVARGKRLWQLTTRIVTTEKGRARLTRAVGNLVEDMLTTEGREQWLARIEKAVLDGAVRLGLRAPTPGAPRPVKMVYHFPEVDDGRCVVLIAQLLYTREEAAAREAEDLAIAAAAAAATKAFIEWTYTDEGDSRLERVSVQRVGDASDVYRKMRAELSAAKERALAAVEACSATKERERAFAAGEPLHLHRFRTANEAAEAVAAAQEAEKRALEGVEEASRQTNEAKRRRKMRVREMSTDTVNRLVRIVGDKARAAVIDAGRRAAMDSGARRPWDGLHGADFALFKLARQREKADRGEDAEAAEAAAAAAAAEDLDESYESDFEKLDKFEPHDSAAL
jgi:hypothetical protein